MYMPVCNGIELSRVIRQIDAFVSIPIVFLSSEMNLKKQLTAMSTGGDDFLTKPIQPDHLISSISLRAERMRIIRSFMHCDSLTGLLNHTKIKEQMDIAVDRARRRKGTLAVAMIDIDRFKAINDTYGHPAGDRVIKSLANLLRQRLRRTDIIGRYGGEEFVVILDDTEAEKALILLDEIRVNFSGIKHQSEGREFHSTFSCGIAAFPQCPDETFLANTADKALYEAKNSGRNRVVLKQRQITES
jgi:diguanylate cyclase (GGDEF)-like protein